MRYIHGPDRPLVTVRPFTSLVILSALVMLGFFRRIY